jgi:hypothetical protein
MSGPRSPILLTAALGGLAVAGCFRDAQPPLGCEAEICVATTTGATGQDPSAPSTGEPTTGEAAPPGRTFRIDKLEIIDPHFFFSEGGCFDGSPLLNSTLKDNIDSGEFNVVLKFEEFTPDDLRPELTEVESCDLVTDTCVPKPGQVSLQVPAEKVAMAPCSQLDPAVISDANEGSLHDPQPPCYRTAAAELALPFEGAALPINLRASQVVFAFDDPNEPTTVTDGLIYGFFTQESAAATTISVGNVEYALWPLIETPTTCVDMFPEQLPSTDILMDGDVPLSGVWLAANFTATQVELLPLP